MVLWRWCASRSWEVLWRWCASRSWYLDGPAALGCAEGLGARWSCGAGCVEVLGGPVALVCVEVLGGPEALMCVEVLVAGRSCGADGR